MKQAKVKTRYGSDVMADMLRMLDIEYAAINPGSTFRGLHDSIVNHLGNKKPEIILCNHEEIAVSIAHGYGKVARKPMAAIVHNVVGLLHGTLAIYNAWLNEAPMLVLGATGPMDVENRRPWIDWIHTALVQGNVVRDYVKWDDQPSSLAGVVDSFIRAHQIATTDPQGPVYLCLDAGLQENLLAHDVPLPASERHPKPSRPQADADTIGRVAKLLVKAQRPVVIANYLGRNPAAVASLIELAELLALPVIDGGARFNFPNTHPLDLTGAEDELLKDADLVLALDVPHLYQDLTAKVGSTRRTDYRIPDNCRIVHFSLAHFGVKSWSHNYGKLTMMDIPVTADTSLALPLLIAACRNLLTEKRTDAVKKRFHKLQLRHHALRKEWQAMAANEGKKSPVTLPWLAREVWEVVKNDDWAIVGNDISGWARRLWDWEKPYRFGGGEIGLGCGLGHALGASLAHRSAGRFCVQLQADGDFLFTPAGLWTAAHSKIPMLIIMNNNRTYFNSERHQETMAKTRQRPIENKGIGTKIDGPPVNFAGLARDFGLYGVGPIEKPQDLRPALAEAARFVREQGRAALVDVVTFPSRA